LESFSAEWEINVHFEKDFFLNSYASILVIILFCDYSKSDIKMVFTIKHIFEKYATSLKVCFRELKYEHAGHAKFFFPSV